MATPTPVPVAGQLVLASWGATVTAALTDSGWTTSGLVFASGWSAATPAFGWRSLAYRSIGKHHWLNGLITKTTAIAANETMVTIPVGARPSGVFQGLADGMGFDISSVGVVRVLAAHASGVMGVDLAWVID